jgi:hypothetical protein
MSLPFVLFLAAVLLFLSLFPSFSLLISSIDTRGEGAKEQKETEIRLASILDSAPFSRGFGKKKRERKRKKRRRTRREMLEG